MFIRWHSLDYMTDKLCIEESKVAKICMLLYKNYDTTLGDLKVDAQPPRPLSIILFFFHA